MVGSHRGNGRGFHPVGALAAIALGVATGLTAVMVPGTGALAASRPTLSAEPAPAPTNDLGVGATPSTVPTPATTTPPTVPPTTAPPVTAPPAPAPPPTVPKPTPTTAPAPKPAPPPAADTHQAASLPADAPAGDYAFLALDQGRPVRYDPCRPIHYTANLALAPANGLADLQEAVHRISDATGITFVYDGTTDEIPTSHRNLHPSNALPSGWPPVVVAWTRPTDTDLFTPGSIGEGGSTWSGFPGHEIYVTGLVVLDATQNDRLAAGFGGRSLGAVLMHELGHVVGLDHVPDQSQIMYANVTDKPAALGAGDLDGLHLVGRSQGCLG